LLFCTTIKLILRRSFDGEESMKKVAQFKAADTGALAMTWTSWLQQTDPSTGNSRPIMYYRRHSHLFSFTGWFDGWLAIGGAAGQITIIRITVSADSSVSVVQQHACLPSQKSVTLLKWLKTGQLVVGRLGEVVIWSPGAELLFKLPFENYREWPTIREPRLALESGRERSGKSWKSETLYFFARTTKFQQIWLSYHRVTQTGSAL
jgi:hypothetical protein